MESIFRIFLLRRIIKEIYSLESTVQPVIIAIDGRSASGKTTLATRIQKEIKCGVIHMDDFFLRPEQRTEKRYEEAGGNVDYERFLDEVMIPLRGNRKFAYRPFDCSTMTFSPPIEVTPGTVTIIEGAYSCHPVLWNYYDLRVFMSVNPDTQKRLIRQRNGDGGYIAFEEKWIPMEERYFAAYHLPERCDLAFHD